MGENKIDIDQKIVKTNTDQQQIYGSHVKGLHNLEETSPLLPINNNGKGASNKQLITNKQYPGNQAEEEFLDSYKIEDETYKYSDTGRLNENEKAKMVSSVEGDDEDILGETENARRNEQINRAKETNQGNPQNR